MNEELKDWTESLGKKASDHEFCMICTKQINELKKENARLREALESISKRASDLIVLSQDLYDDVSSLERGE